MREKLRRLGLDLPLLPTTAVGSYPKPEQLVEARRMMLAGRLKPRDLREMEERATKEWIALQEEIGL
ncbi:MAG: hypothetical protein NZ934_01320, partial [Hadesarchaea archaeon]|nr:hypothetical protein [Hadesarchaea archaeon]